MNQVIINILNTAFVYLLLSMSFSIEYYTTKFFNLFHAIIFAVSGYLVYLFSTRWGWNIYLSIPLSVILSTLLGMFSEVFVFRYLRQRKINSFQMMIASLGLYIVFQNIISMIWGDSSLSIRQGKIEVGNRFLGGYITNNQISTIVITGLLFVCLLLLLKYTRTGKKMRAVSSNSNLSKILGINNNKIFVNSYIIGSFIASIAGILIALETDLSPNMGFNLFLYGAIVLIIGGTGSLWALLGGAILLSAAQNLGAYYISSQWMDAIAYVILILFLIWKPLGFSGKRLKKVEI
jgi:branched-chain amino acid transport system permease protein